MLVVPPLVSNFFSWCSKRQDPVTQSNTEVEYQVMTDPSMELK